MKTLVALLFFLTSSVQAEMIYDWSGHCNKGCTGEAQAVITFFDYVPGTFIPDNTFPVEFFQYTDNTGHVFFHDPFNSIGTTGTLPVTSGFAAFTWRENGMDYVLNELLDGTWTLLAEGFGEQKGMISGGIDGVFAVRSSVPEPASALLIVLALTSLAWMRRRV